MGPLLGLISVGHVSIYNIMHRKGFTLAKTLVQTVWGFCFRVSASVANCTPIFANTKPLPGHDSPKDIGWHCTSTQMWT